MKKAVSGVLLCFSVVFILLFAGCGATMEDQLIGSWYYNSNEPYFIFYDDGTCEIEAEYGTGTWGIVNDNQLKVSNYYGETDVYAIVSIDGQKMTLDVEGAGNVDLYRGP